MKSKAKIFVPLKLWRETRFSCAIRQRQLPVNASATRHILFIGSSPLIGNRLFCGSRAS
jgi:hypothetical protein